MEDIEPGMRYLPVFIFDGKGRVIYDMGKEFLYDAAGNLSEERDLLSANPGYYRKSDSPGYYRRIVHHPNAKGKDTLSEEYYGSDLAKISYSRFHYDELDSLISIEFYKIRYPQQDYILSHGTMKFDFSPDHRIKRMMLAGGKNYDVIPDSFFYNGFNDTFYFSKDGIYEGMSEGAYHYNKDGMVTRMYAKGQGFLYDETYTYNKNGNIAEIIWYVDSIRYREVFTYDDEGKPLEQIRYSPDGKEKRVLKYSYTYK
jgi:hypothetical protein